tara:strand:+ start:329 stop:715 length:387 start_codon:yes stop_codon:yes gene_type:complete
MASILKVNTFTGASTAGSIAVTAEGNSTTTNLQQGLAKAWAMASTSASVNDSLNVSGGTDNGTGDYSYAVSNSMNSTSYTVVGNCGQDDIGIQGNKARATGSYRVRHNNASGSAVDVDNNTNVHGDLA